MTGALCIYCGTTEADTRDHVPPKSLLPKPYRPNLRTVPACLACNAAHSSDEEYFRNILFTLLAPTTPEAEALFDGPVTRAFDRGPNVEDAVWNLLGEEEGRPFVRLDPPRITNVAAKIVRGLAFLTYGVPLPADAQFHFTIYNPDAPPAALERALNTVPVESSDAPAFQSRHARSREAGYSFLWELCFFQAFAVGVGVAE